MSSWILYGAYGYTGRLVAEEALGRGLGPILAGRDRESLETLGDSLGLETRAFDLEDRHEVGEALEGTAAVLHCAGPFLRTSPPMVAACLERGVHYLDITGEIPVFESILARSEEAAAAGTVLLPGVGFDVVPTDCLAARLASELPAPARLDLAFASPESGFSAGTLKTMVEMLPNLGAVRRDGHIVPVPPAADVREIPFGCGRLWAMTIPWGDVSTAYHTTGIPDIRTYAAVPRKQVRWLRRWAVLLPLLALPPVKRLLQKWIDARVEGPDEETRERARSYLWGRVESDAGEHRSATFDTPEAYRFTATAAVESVRRVLAGEVEPGAWTPGGAFGPDYVRSLPGVSAVRLSGE